MKVYIIGDKENPVSVEAMARCQASLNIPSEIFQQTSPNTLKSHLKDFHYISWTYPLNDQFKIDRETGVILNPYRAQSLDKIFSCTISHARLWKKSVELQEEIMVLEHDAVFIRDFKEFNWDGGAIGLNDPRGATHSSNIFHNIVSKRNGVQDAPWVKSKHERLQGLAGNSAYIIRPHFAQKLLDKMQQTGGWPNDSLMCKQFFPEELKVVYPYFTRVQGVRSTTTL